MKNHAVVADHLGKLYWIQSRRRHNQLRDAIAHQYASVLGRFSRILSPKNSSSKDGSSRSIWALKDVSFEIPQGEVIGIIGRNGAGKSTLLKILSSITEPTEGTVMIYGKVGSLIEVGTGFHPELSGRDNIFLNGAILGMKRAEIQKKFDEIIAFSEVEKFVETPVKYYSSGMYVRLAFAVAAHLEPDILLVDEVLAVGDVAFQKKCLGKMDDVSKLGRTVVLVSHQMNSIRRLCQRVLWLDSGKVQMFDSTIKVISSYESALMSSESVAKDDENHVAARFLRWEILEPKGDQPNVLAGFGPVKFKIIVRINKPIQNAVHGIALYNSAGQLIWAWSTYKLNLEPMTHEFIYSLPGLPLRPGVYSWHVSLYSDGALLDTWHSIPEFVIATDPVTHPRDEWSGILNIPCDFQMQRAEDV
jgi:lipopolysaccharide transport system ATP-binding protein